MNRPSAPGCSRRSPRFRCIYGLRTRMASSERKLIAFRPRITSHRRDRPGVTRSDFP
jgi:hypothetical protein